MRTLTEPMEPSGLVTWSRYALLGLALIFVAGAVIQVFLAGLGVFDPADPGRWDDHRNTGHVVGLLTYFVWIPAVLGRVGVRLIVASVLLLVLYGLQYAFVEAGDSTVNALHPVNGVLLFAVAAWIAQRTLALIRGTDEIRAPGGGPS